MSADDTAASTDARLRGQLKSFMSALSHDLRAPLVGIDGMAMALSEDCGHQLDALGTDYVERIREGVVRTVELLDAVLTLGRVLSAELAPSDVDITRLAGEVAQELALHNPQREVTVEIQPGMSAHADAGLLATVLGNLLANAWKFTSKQDAARITVGQDAQGWFVADDGVGFDMAYADRLFGVFERLHSPRDFEGMGVGLAAVKWIVERHGGRVSARGEVGGGATFHFTLCP